MQPVSPCILRNVDQRRSMNMAESIMEFIILRLPILPTPWRGMPQEDQDNLPTIMLLVQCSQRTNGALDLLPVAETMWSSLATTVIPWTNSILTSTLLSLLRDTGLLIAPMTVDRLLLRTPTEETPMPDLEAKSWPLPQAYLLPPSRPRCEAKEGLKLAG